LFLLKNKDDSLLYFLISCEYLITLPSKQTMAPPNKDVFLQSWPKCFISFMAIIEVICVIILILTEIGNVAANFWTTNAFVGGWCGLIMLVHLVSLFFAGKRILLKNK
jgi:hypothetical protein